jgi:hypothetical protein
VLVGRFAGASRVGPATPTECDQNRGSIRHLAKHLNPACGMTLLDCPIQGEMINGEIIGRGREFERIEEQPASPALG